MHTASSRNALHPSANEHMQTAHHACRCDCLATPRMPLRLPCDIGSKSCVTRYAAVTAVIGAKFELEYRGNPSSPPQRRQVRVHARVMGELTLVFLRSIIVSSRGAADTMRQLYSTARIRKRCIINKALSAHAVATRQATPPDRPPCNHSARTTDAARGRGGGHHGVHQRTHYAPSTQAFTSCTSSTRASDQTSAAHRSAPKVTYNATRHAKLETKASNACPRHE